ncbi:MAG TPA: alpha/beta hydrolase domain-containing protein [Anaeromyxobacter sp.]
MTRLAAAFTLGMAASLAFAPEAQARITRIVFTRVESPTFGGRSFGTVGQFEKLVGTAFGEVDPADPHDAIIQDLELAPRNGRGKVEYSTDVYVIKPIDMSKGNGMLFYNVHNRGNKGGLNTFNLGTAGGNEPANTPQGAGDGFLQNMGYTIVWSGWQPDVLPGNNRMTATVPVAANPDGTSITGVVRSELKLGPGGTATTTLNLSSGHFTGLTHASYPTVSTDNQTPLADGFLPALTQRRHVNDPRVPIPDDQWSFASCPAGGPAVVDATKICFPAGFQPGVLYELIYRAKDPTVLGLGWASMRDVVSFFKHAAKDDAGNANPLALPGRPALAVMEGSSQSGRSIRTFIHLGFNEDEDGRIVFEGAFPHIGGGRLSMNVRFAAPGRAWGYTVDHLYPAYEFPFSYMPSHDPITGRTGGLLERCLKSHSCPRIFHVATALEIWEGRQSLGFTDPLGKRDLGEPGFIRTYIMASTQHGTAGFNPTSGPAFGDCEQQQNPNPQAETMRALWVAFTQWVKDGVEPPPSSKPRANDGTFVPPADVRFPSIPANSYPNVSPAGLAAPTVRLAVRWQHVATPLHVLDYGAGFDAQDEGGIITKEPPAEGQQAYGVLVPQVDGDGNDLAGIRSVRLQVPLATYTGWNMGAQGLFEDGLCSLSGSYIPFAPTEADLVAGDPRPSIEKRYGTHQGYVDAVTAAADRLVAQRFLLPADRDRLVAEAANGRVLVK